jgi:hypothetical protein
MMVTGVLIALGLWYRIAAAAFFHRHDVRLPPRLVVPCEAVELGFTDFKTPARSSDA